MKNLLRFSFFISAIALCNLALCQIEVDSNNNVGIGIIPSGTTLPQKFNVYGNSYINGNLSLGVASTSYKLHVSGNSYVSQNSYVNGNLGIGVTSTSYKLHVDGNSYFSQNSYVNGNLGVGVTSTSYKLHVAGNSYVSQNSYINGNLGIGTTSTTYKLDVNGTVKICPSSLVAGKSMIFDSCSEVLNGNIVSCCYPCLYPSDDKGASIGKSGNKFFWVRTFNIECPNPISSSDVRIKENIRICPPLLSKLKNVNSYNFNYYDEFFQGLTEEMKEYYKRNEYGFIAQEIQEIFPELVYATDSTGMLSLKYISFVPILTAALNELNMVVESQASVINDLQREVEYLRNYMVQTNTKNSEERNNIQFDLSNNINSETEEMKVYQNAPNPFNENTTIKCYIPKSVNKAQLCIYDMQGIQVKCLEIAERGTVDVQIIAGQLSSGIYTYLLIGDRKTSESKIMVLTK